MNVVILHSCFGTRVGLLPISGTGSTKKGTVAEWLVSPKARKTMLDEKS